MEKIAALKAQAKILVQAMADIGMMLSHGQALEAVAKQYGFANWDTLAGVVQAKGGESAEVTLSIPSQVRSLKGVELVLLTSHDGAAYDKYVIVPPHLDKEVIKKRIFDEILRLKARDEETGLDDPEAEYTDADLAAFVAKLGCLWVSDPDTVGENWD